MMQVEDGVARGERRRRHPERGRTHHDPDAAVHLVVRRALELEREPAVEAENVPALEEPLLGRGGPVQVLIADQRFFGGGNRRIVGVAAERAAVRIEQRVVAAVALPGGAERRGEIAEPCVEIVPVGQAERARPPRSR